MGQQLTIRFPSGASEEKVKKDATKIQKSNPGMAYHDALDAAAKKHGATSHYRSYITQARAESPRPPAPDEVLLTPNGNIQYCVSCERPATKKDFFGLPRCKYHGNPDIEDEDIPPYKGAIPEGTYCFDSDCDQEATHILGGVCFCDEHYEDARQGNRYRRNLGL